MASANLKLAGKRTAKFSKVFNIENSDSITSAEFFVRSRTGQLVASWTIKNGKVAIKSQAIHLNVPAAEIAKLGLFKGNYEFKIRTKSNQVGFGVLHGIFSLS